MSATTSKPYSWIRKLPSSLLKLDEIPLFGNPPEFNWEQLQSELQTALQVEDLVIHPSAFEWTPVENLFKKLGENTVPLKLAISPLEGYVYWLMPEKEISELLFLLLGQKAEVFHQIDPDFEQGFYMFLALEAIAAAARSGLDPALTPQVQPKSERPQSPMLCMDVTLKLRNKSFLGRLYVTPELRKSFKTRYEKTDKDSSFRPPLSEQIELTVHLEAGSTSIPLNEWKKIAPGDVLMLDHCSLKPGDDKGKVMLTIKGHPFFRGKVKDGNIKILEHSLYYETEKAMDDTPPEEEEKNHPEDEEEEGWDEEEDEEEWGEEDEEEEPEKEEEEPEEDTDKEEAETETEEKEEEGEHEAKEEEERHVAAKEIPEEQKKGPTKPVEIPLPVVIEVGRIQMTVQSLMDLEPGNLLDLDVHPDSGIDLVVNGNRVGKGELVQIGELLGVRITEMG